MSKKKLRNIFIIVFGLFFLILILYAVFITKRVSELKIEQKKNLPQAAIDICRALGDVSGAPLSSDLIVPKYDPLMDAWLNFVALTHQYEFCQAFFNLEPRQKIVKKINYSQEVADRWLAIGRALNNIFATTDCNSDLTQSSFKQLTNNIDDLNKTIDGRQFCLFLREKQSELKIDDICLGQSCRAIVLQDGDLCNSLTDKNMVQTCLDSVNYMLALKNKDSDQCSKIKNPIVNTSCQAFFLTKSNDVCRPIITKLKNDYCSFLRD